MNSCNFNCHGLQQLDEMKQHLNNNRCPFDIIIIILLNSVNWTPLFLSNSTIPQQFNVTITLKSLLNYAYQY